MSSIRRPLFSLADLSFPVISLNYQYLIGVVLGCFVVRYAVRLSYHAATAGRRIGFSYSTVGEDAAGKGRAGGWSRIVAWVQRIDAWMQESPKIGSLSGEWTRIRLLFTVGIIAINVLFAFVRSSNILLLPVLIHFDCFRSSRFSIRRCSPSRQTQFASSPSQSDVSRCRISLSSSL